MKKLAVSRRYAKALLLIGKEDGRAEAYKEELAAFAGFVETQAALINAITNPLYPAESRRAVLEAVAAKAGLSPLMRVFVLLLFDKGRFPMIGEISRFYDRLVDELNSVARATVESAYALSDDAVEKIRERLCKMTGKNVVLDVRQDPELIGGIVTRIGDLVLDGSVRNQLKNLKESFTRGESV